LSTTSGSADSTEKADWGPLTGRSVTIWPDKDEAGLRYAKEITSKLLDLDCVVKLVDVDLLDLPRKGDAVDWLTLHEGASAEEIHALVCTPAERPRDEVEGKGRQGSQTDQILEICQAFTLFNTPLGSGYAVVEFDGHQEVHKIKSRSFAKLLNLRYFEQTGAGLRHSVLNDAMPTIEAQALFQGETKKVYRRVACLRDKIVIDMCDGAWRVIEITKSGWQILDRSPVMFDRKSGMTQLPVPEREGDVESLRQFANVSKTDFVLLVGWMLGALKGDCPFPVLALNGEEGSGKSTLTKNY